MEFKTLVVAAGMFVASLGITGAADAQRHGPGPGPDRFEHRGPPGRHDVRGPRGPHHVDRHRGPRGRHYAYGRHDRCRVIYRHHRRVRVCR